MNTALILILVVSFALTRTGIFWKLVNFSIERILHRVHPIRDVDGKQIRGPAYIWPNSQAVEKFLQAKQKSAEWREQYGRIYRVWCATIPEVVISTPQDVAEFYKDSHNHYKAQSSNGGWIFHEVLGDCLGLISTDRWNNVRSVFGIHFSLPQARNSLPALQDAAKDFISNLKKDSDGALKGTGVVEVNATEAFKLFPFYFMMELLYGKLDTEENILLQPLINTHDEIFRHIVQGGLNRSRLAQVFRTEGYRALQRLTISWRKFNQVAYEKKVDTHLELPIISLWQSMKRGKISEKELLQTLYEILFANLDVTTHVISWAIVQLAMSVDIQDQVRAEACRYQDNLVGYIDRTDTLLHWCILESLRLNPVLAFSVPESASVDKILGDYKVPAKTNVTVDTLTLNTDPQLWGPNSTVYDPKRFSSIRSSDLRYNLASFGFGPRKCLGRHLAFALVQALITNLLLSFRVSVASSPSGLSTSSDQWVQVAGLTLQLTELQPET